MLRFYRTPIPGSLPGVLTEWCYYAQLSAGLTVTEFQHLRWLLGETFEPDGLNHETFLSNCPSIIEIGPRPNFETAWSTTAVSICHACGLDKIVRLEHSRRYGFDRHLSDREIEEFLAAHHDRMTEMQYVLPPDNFMVNKTAEPFHIIHVIEDGADAIRAINKQLGLGMDEQDIGMYDDLFANILKRNPTDVELFQLGQANSEHSRHGFFRGQLVIDGQPLPETLMEIVKSPWQKNPGNSVIAMCDDSSALMGRRITILRPGILGVPSTFQTVERLMHPTLTAETHNFPSGIEPYNGAETGTGGREGDNAATGQSGFIIAGGAGYCVANLHIPGYDLPWEQDGWRHPANLASPLNILIRASDGASDYGNCFGEPVIYGYTRSFGTNLLDEYRGWFKPIMYTVGSGLIDDRHTKKGLPEKGMLIVQIGGPAYRIGMGGGAASSMVQGENAVELDFNAVQRGDPQMRQCTYRVIKACAEKGDDNPIITIHDLGAGGDCNALPELVDPAGAVINLRAIPVGDQTLSTLEIWGNESQERWAFLIKPERYDEISEICRREDVPCAIVGQVTGDGYLILHDDNDGTEPVNLPLERILGQLPQKTFNLEPWQPERVALKLPEGLTVRDALDRVLRLLSVGSKRFLTTKVDRSVTGLVAQQQCVGPNHVTLCDYAVIAHSYLELTGTALSLGEQPMIGLISPSAMSRMAVTEMLLNLVGANITKLEDVKLSANWMLAAKEPGEGAWLYDAACALRDMLIELRIAIDGGKDSLSMAAKTISPDGQQHIVKAPGELVLAAYAMMDDITRKVTPDLKRAGHELLFIDLADGKHRLGGSALAQVYGQVGDECPDMNDTPLLVRTFNTVQELVASDLIASVHDRSDGGLITAFLEMAFSGNLGINLVMQTETDPCSFLFNQEAGLVIECNDSDKVRAVLDKHGILYEHAGWVTDDLDVTVYLGDELVLNEPMVTLRSVWEETSSQIDRLQANPECVAEEAANIRNLFTPPPYHLTFSPEPTPDAIMNATNKPKVAIIRERGSNGDREMNAAFYLAGFNPWDVTMTDLLEGRASLDDFRGVAFVGGFSFADVLDAGKGWAGVIRFNDRLKEMFERFRNRPDTFSLGVCNGCQLMALLGWVPGTVEDPKFQPHFIRNRSGRFESRFSTVRIVGSPAIMLKGMAGSTLGIWTAHGEGQLHFPDPAILTQVLQQKLATLSFLDELGIATDRYPFNPNGSPLGITALCSPDGRHLAMMPHPERTFLTWQWPWLPDEWKHLSASPWLKLFQNAYTWCMQNK